MGQYERTSSIDPTDEREEETELSQTGLRRRGESPAIRHREATVTAPLLDSTCNLPVTSYWQILRQPLFSVGFLARRHRWALKPVRLICDSVNLTW